MTLKSLMTTVPARSWSSLLAVSTNVVLSRHATPFRLLRWRGGCRQCFQRVRSALWFSPPRRVSWTMRKLAGNTYRARSSVTSTKRPACTWKVNVNREMAAYLHTHAWVMCKHQSKPRSDRGLLLFIPVAACTVVDPLRDSCES